MTTQDIAVETRKGAETERCEATRAAAFATPATDIYEREDAVVVLADLPGVDGRNVDITLENNVLTIRGRAAVAEPQEADLLHREYRTTDYERSFTLTDDVDREKIKATMKQGVLRIELPKAAEKQPRKISVDAG